jgi:hypothetical protein
VRRASHLLLLLVAALLAGVPGAAAAAAPRWSLIAAGGMHPSDQVGLARTSDGVLHVAWRREGATEDLLQTPITASGKVGAPVVAVSGWNGIGSPALVANGSDLAVFFPGIKTAVTGDPTFGLNLATSTDAGLSWTERTEAIARNDFAATRTPAAVLAVRGPFVQAWYGGDDTVVHSGLDPNVPAAHGYGGGTDQGLAAAADGQVMVGWCTELEAETGVFAARVDTATGARVGDAVHLPDTGRCPADTRVAIASFPLVPRDEHSGEPYFYVAASSADGRTVRVYVIAAGQIVAVQKVAGGSSFKQQIAIAAAPRGGVWVAWRDSESDDLVVRRSDPFSGFDYGGEATRALPRGQGLDQLALNAQGDRVDAVATTTDQAGAVNVFATQILPGLTLEGGTAKKLEKKGFRVLDSRDAVRDATVKVARHTLKTDRRGYAKVRLEPGSYKATASKAGYSDAVLRFRIR